MLLFVTFQPSLSPVEQHTHVGALIDNIPDLMPQQDMLTEEDVHYWRYRDDEEDKATIQTMLYEEDPQEAIKKRLNCGGAYVEEILDD